MRSYWEHVKKTHWEFEEHVKKHIENLRNMLKTL
jgi:hypothetical protein